MASTKGHVMKNAALVDLAKVCAPNLSEYKDCPRHWLRKAEAVAQTDGTMEAVSRAMVNFPEMNDYPKSKWWIQECERIGAALLVWKATHV